MARERGRERESLAGRQWFNSNQIKYIYVHPIVWCKLNWNRWKTEFSPVFFTPSGLQGSRVSVYNTLTNTWTHTLSHTYFVWCDTRVKVVHGSGNSALQRFAQVSSFQFVLPCLRGGGEVCVIGKTECSFRVWPGPGLALATEEVQNTTRSVGSGVACQGLWETRELICLHSCQTER